MRVPSEMGPTLKQCRVCREEKAREDFSVKRAERDGRNPYCKACERKRVAAFQAADPQYRARKAAYDRRRQAEQKPKLNAQCRAYHARNRDAGIARAAAWARQNRAARRAIANAYKGRRRDWCGEGISGPELRAWVSDQLLVCAYCFAACAEDFEIDHVEPLAMGGKHSTENLCIACPTCNRRKSAKPLLRFLLERQREGREVYVPTEKRAFAA